jgi:hypothetical protein
VQRLLMRHGLEPADDATGPADRLAEEFPVPAGIVGASVQGRVALELDSKLPKRACHRASSRVGAAADRKEVPVHRSVVND